MPSPVLALPREQHPARMATTLGQALASSIATFHERSGKEGDKYQRRKRELKELPSFMGVSVGTPRTEPHQRPCVSPHHWGRSGGRGRARSSLRQVPPICQNHPLRLMPTVPQPESAVLHPTDALCQEQLDERSFWVLLKDLEDKDNMMDFKEYVVLLGCLTMLCNNFCAKACGPASRHRAPAHGSNKTAVTFPVCLFALGSPAWECLGPSVLGRPGPPRKLVVRGTVQ